MSKLNRDILYLIFEELQNDKRSLSSCLSVNKIWCEIIIPILWKNPWKYLKHKEKELLLLNVIISHLSDESKNNLKSQGWTNSYQRPLFDYISFCRHLNLYKIKIIIERSASDEESISILENEIFNLFINENIKYKHLYIPIQFNYPIHLNPKAKHCFSDIEFLSCHASINDNILIGLTEICKYVKEINLFIGLFNNNYGIVNLIEAQKNLQNIRFIDYYQQNRDESFCIILENSLIEHANTVQNLKITKPFKIIPSFFVNLKRLELGDTYIKLMEWDYLEKSSLPFLRVLKASNVPIKVLTSLIKSTSGYLIEINIDYINHDDVNNKRIIQAIYQNCPRLNYLKLLIRNSNILELEKLLNNCHYLNGLCIIVDRNIMINWNGLFQTLAKSSPASLFKFKLCSNSFKEYNLDSLKVFFDNWNDRHPILLQTIRIFTNHKNINNLIIKYKEKGIVKKYDNDISGTTFDEFEWIQKKS
ncbi:hypothetical protein C1645_879878 [Glomus cerebriforme]|uniref:F-box domain-containing protein n=1 Tax=Glomus cerebriforme TaxID=658196 RepID=A0A397SE50_9GLOM|nr:hypothetical protein C1645_879878 [Glomus cerebriforme]